MFSREPINSRTRRGAAAVEAAICLPVLLLVVFGAMEVSAGISHQYNLKSATYELAKVALKPQTTCKDVQVLANELLPQFDFDTYSVEIDVITRTVNSSSVGTPTTTKFSIPQSGPPTEGLDQVPRGTLLRLSVTAGRPKAITNFLKSGLGNQVRSDCAFVKEF